MTVEQLIVENRQLRAEVTGLRAEVSRLTTRHVKRAPDRDALARKAYDACAALFGWATGAKVNDDIRRGFWYAAFQAGISIAVMARVSHTHHAKVSRFVSSPTDTSTLAYRKAREAARAVFKEAAATSA